MDTKTITLTDAQIKALSLQMGIRPNLISALPTFDSADTVMPSALDEAGMAVLTAAL